MIVGVLLDTIVVVILVLTFMIGIKKGLVAMTKGLISLIVILATTFFIVAPTTAFLLARVDWDERLAVAITDTTDRVFGLDNHTVLLYLSEEEGFDSADGERIVGLVYRGEDNVLKNFKHLREDSTFVQGIGLAIVERHTPGYLSERASGESVFLINALTNAFAVYIIMGIVGFVLMLMLFIIMFTSQRSLSDNLLYFDSNA